jgi:glycosyltransferase involved in cell wall biosynthesis
MSKSWTLDGKVSIVIPCFNHGEMLRETLESVERARNANLAEVIIVNDGSTDPTTCAYFEELSHSAYKVIHQPNRGLGPARNTGIKAAQGEFILPLDSDNYIREPYLNSGVNVLLERPDVGVVYGDAEYFGEELGRWRVGAFDLRRLVKGNYIDACALYRRAIWESVGGYDEAMPWMGWEDWDFWLRVALRGWGFQHLDGVAFDYRVRSGQMNEESGRHGSELVAYIFSKADNLALRLLRDQGQELDNLKQETRWLSEPPDRVQNSLDYRLGHFLVEPCRKLKHLLKPERKIGSRSC